MSMAVNEPGVFNRFSSRLVYSAAPYSWTKFFESGVLGFQHCFKATLGSRAGFSNNHGSFKLVRVALHFDYGFFNKNVYSPNLAPVVDCMRHGCGDNDLSVEA